MEAAWRRTKDVEVGPDLLRAAPWGVGLTPWGAWPSRPKCIGRVAFEDILSASVCLLLGSCLCFYPLLFLSVHPPF